MKKVKIYRYINILLLTILLVLMLVPLCWTISMSFDKNVLTGIPIIAVMYILQIILNWNSFLWPLIIISLREQYLISVGVSMFNASENTRYLGPHMTVVVINALPIVIMFLFLQKYIVSGIALSRIKQ